MKNKFIQIGLIALIGLGVLSACGTDAKEDKQEVAEEIKEVEDKEIEEEDKEENTDLVKISHELGDIEVATNPEKVISFDLGIVDILDSLGVEVVGLPQGTVPEYLSKYASSDYENLGSMKEADFEKINALSPDLAIISARMAESFDEFNEISPTLFVEMPGATYMETLKENVDLLKLIFTDHEDELEDAYNGFVQGLEEVKEKANDKTALIILVNGDDISAYGEGSRFGIIHSDFGFIPADPNIEVSTHGQTVGFEYIEDINPDYLFVIDRGAAIGTDEGVGAEALLDNEIVGKTDSNIVYLSSDIWYLASGGFTSTEMMIEEVGEALQ